jgi:hypothetical protein
MNIKDLNRLLQVTAITLALTAVCQELEKPKEERPWHGKVVGFVPYDFRFPTLERIRETYWNPYDSRILVPEAFGIGWAINLYSLLERLRLIGQDLSEEDFLMPGEHMKEVLTHALEAE